METVVKEVPKSSRSSSYRSSSRPAWGQQQGSSLLGGIVALALVGALAVIISRSTTTGVQGAKSISIRQDIEMLKKTIRENVSCSASLGFTPGMTLPLSCPTTPIVLRRPNGTVLDLGDWTSNVLCTNGNSGSLRIGVQRPGRDPLSKKLWTQMPSNDPTVSIAVDLFGGTSAFCMEYLSTTASCGGTYPLRMGAGQGGARCCRVEEYIATVAPTFIGTSTCLPSEFVLGGGTSCHSDETLSADTPTYARYNHVSFIDWQTNSFRGDCNEMAQGGLLSPSGVTDGRSKTYAICCPR